jgi:hypothetical protein
MSRVFTINFSFKGKNYSALVSSKSEGSTTGYLVRYLNEDITALIPGNELLVSLTGDIKYPQPVNGLARNLVHKTTETINSYLHLPEN